MKRSDSVDTVMRPRTAFVVMALAAILLGTAGCGRLMGRRTAPVELPPTPAGVVGQIKTIDHAEQEEVWGTILVEGAEQTTGTVSDKALVTITVNTRIASENRWIPPEDLTVGMKVRVWFISTVAESYPVQGTAEFIEVP